MTLEDTLARLKSLGDEKVLAQNRRNGAGDNQFGVRLGDIRKLAPAIKSDDELARALWDTGNPDACLQGLHLSVRADLDQRNGAAATLNHRRGEPS
jgi:3-methyladenine DNA glycosylase AlkD